MEEKCDHVEITDSKLSVEFATELVRSPLCGAVALFVGVTRDNIEGKKVLQLEYEAYSTMAKSEMKKICKEIRERWEVQHTALLHRIGIVPLSEASVIIAVSSPHRRESLEAVNFAIDSLKANVPIWKKEVYEEGPPSWKENKECHWSTKTS
eukprot:GHVT01056161.1.p1 GENE.GHVT01056161.1~~GHVT01056161.1.p1  ORF type:complete len:152 (+),score=4.29 GHVT01056161.1:136-591(+)